MAQLLCLEEPDLLSLETQVALTRPGAVALVATPFYPGGGGQLPDRGRLRWPGGDLAIVGLEKAGDVLWHLLEGDGPLPLVRQTLEAAVEPGFRATMQALHTGLHLVNALVFKGFDGALVTGVQMTADGTARIDFDLPDADNDRLRALEGPINEAIRRDLPVSAQLVPFTQAQAEPGTLRSRSVAPPVGDDGLIRVIEIAGLDRQACGGTHLPSTGSDGRVLRILKIENKGRHNRRIRIGLADG